MKQIYKIISTIFFIVGNFSFCNYYGQEASTFIQWHTWHSSSQIVKSDSYILSLLPSSANEKEQMKFVNGKLFMRGEDLDLDGEADFEQTGQYELHENRIKITFEPQKNDKITCDKIMEFCFRIERSKVQNRLELIPISCSDF